MDTHHAVISVDGSTVEPTRTLAREESTLAASLASDVDPQAVTKESAPHLRPHMRISVIVPVLNEAGTIRDCLDAWRNAPGPVEVIVVDGGSTDATADLVAATPGVRWVRSHRRGRAAQMNAGARLAGGDVLLFLHADTRLPASATEEILGSFEPPGVVGGRFELRLSERGSVYSLIGRLSTWRSRFLGITYGDQAIYASRSAFESAGGFPELPLFEDSEFCNRLSRLGRFVMLPLPAVTSARRWKREGVFRTILRMWMLRLMYVLSVDVDRLARLYRNVR